MLNRKQSPIEDKKIEGFLPNKPLNFKVSLNKTTSCQGADFVIIATPTDCDLPDGLDPRVGISYNNPSFGHGD